MVTKAQSHYKVSVTRHPSRRQLLKVKKGSVPMARILPILQRTKSFARRIFKGVLRKMIFDDSHSCLFLGQARGKSPADPIYDLISKDASYEGSILEIEKHHLSLCNMKLFQHLALYQCSGLHLHHINTHFKPAGARCTGGIAGILQRQGRLEEGEYIRSSVAACTGGLISAQWAGMCAYTSISIQMHVWLLSTSLCQQASCSLDASVRGLIEQHVAQNRSAAVSSRQAARQTFLVLNLRCGDTQRRRQDHL